MPIGIYQRTLEHNQNISKALKGKKIRLGMKNSSEHNRKIALAHLGKKLSIFHRKSLSLNHADVSEEKNPCWKGENASYIAKHEWMRRKYGKAIICQNPKCNFKNPKRYEWANISGQYKRNKNDYIQLCPSCHRKWDMKKLFINIKIIESDNLRINTTRKPSKEE